VVKKGQKLVTKQSGKQRNSHRAKPGRSKRQAMPLPAEDRRAEAVTVAWMLATIATFGAELMGVVVFLFVRFSNSPTESPAPLRNLPPLMLFTALIVGLISLVMVPVVYRFRRVPPPRSATIISVLIALLPIILLAVSFFLA